MAGKLVLPRSRRAAGVAGAVVVLAATLAWTHAHPRLAADVGDRPLHTFQASGFRVDLPCKPTEIKHSQQIATGTVSVLGYLCTGGTDGYTVSSTSLPAMTAGALDMNRAANEAAHDLGGTAADVTTTTVQGHPAVDFRIPDAVQRTEKATVFARVVYTGSTLYQLDYIKNGNGRTAAPARYAAFRDSLHID